MTDHYEDTDDARERVLKNRQVLGFIAGFWLRRDSPLYVWEMDTAGSR